MEWQEIVQHAEDGELHIADVKTDDGWVIEFQHSNIKPEERRSREAFYPKLIWVVDGVRRKTDKARFQKALDESVAPFPEYAQLRKVRSHGGALLRDWAGSRAHVFFDFGDKQALWWLLPNTNDINAYVTRISRAQFIAAHRQTGTQSDYDFDSVGEELIGLVSDYESYCRARR